MKTEKKYEQTVISLNFQIILIIISIAILSFLYKHKLNEFNATETTPPLEDYNPESLARFGDFYTNITTGITIEQYEVFDVINNNFIIAGTVWFLVDPSIVDLGTLGKFNFYQGTLLYVSQPDTAIEGNKLFVQYRIRLQFSGNLEYSYFPLDEHRIVIRLTNSSLMPQEALFRSEYRYFNITASIKPFGWAILDKYVKYGYKTLFLDSAHTEKRNDDPCVDFVIDFKRTSYRYIISLIFPMLTFFYLSLFAFSMVSSTRFYLPTGALTALVSFRFIVDKFSPSVGYFMLSDYLFFTFLAVIFITFIFLLFDEISMRITTFYRKIFIVVLHLTVIMLNFYFVL